MNDLPRGWLSDAEAAELQRLADGKIVLELGAWKGRSTVALCRVAKYVVSVDWHRGIAGRPELGDSLPDYLLGVRELPNLAIVVADFADFVPLLSHGFDLVFVDGNHDHEAVKRDAQFAAQHGNVLAFHDWDWPDVPGALRETIGEPHHVVESTAVYE